jgi:hypothetical protein
MITYSNQFIPTGFVSIHILKLGQLFKSSFMVRERTPSWTMALVLYSAGLSLRKISTYLTLHGVKRAHTTTTIWYWLQRLGGKPLWQGPLPLKIVVDETWIQVGGKDCCIGSLQQLTHPGGCFTSSLFGGGTAGALRNSCALRDLWHLAKGGDR